MSNYIKTIYEFYYVVGDKDFHSHYKLAVDRETEKMLYGDSINDEGGVYGRFSIKKGELGVVKEVIDKRYGLVFRIQLEDCGDWNASYAKAKQIAIEYLTEIVEKFENYIRED